jgi:hypothetical protein
MSQSTGGVGEKTRSWVAQRGSLGNEPGNELQATAGFRTRRAIPASYLAKHPCKVCKGKCCTGNCKF